MIRRTPLPRPTRPIKKKKRSAAERERIYGPKGFAEFVHSLPCVACGVVGYSEVAHIKTGGTGRKADWTDTVPLCGFHVEMTPRSITYVAGCHWALDNQGRESFELRWDIDLEVAAIAIQEQWASHTEEG